MRTRFLELMRVAVIVMALTVGARLRHYDVTALIDEGSRGEVYVAG